MSNESRTWKVVKGVVPVPDWAAAEARDAVSPPEVKEEEEAAEPKQTLHVDGLQRSVTLHI